MRGLHLGPDLPHDPTTQDGSRPKLAALLFLAAFLALPAMAGQHPCRVGPFLGIADGPDSVDPLGRCGPDALIFPLLDITPQLQVPTPPLRMAPTQPAPVDDPQRGCTADETRTCALECRGKHLSVAYCAVATDPTSGLLTLWCGCAPDWRALFMTELRVDSQTGPVVR